MKSIRAGYGLAAAAALLAGCHGGRPAPAAAVETVAAHVVESRQQQVPVSLRATGTVHAQQTAVISAQVMGRIEKVLVREGDPVRAGQTLAVLDGAAMHDSTVQAQAAASAAKNAEAAAQSNANLAASTLARYRQLEAEKSVSPQEMDEVSRRAEASAAQLEAARSQTRAARAQADAARSMYNYTRLTAPFSGVVTARLADPGTLAAPGVPLLQVDRAGALELQTAVDESAIASVQVGMKTPVTIGSLPPVTGTVTRILPAADAASHSFQVRISLPASRQLRAGMYGAADFASGARQAIVVPKSAIVERGSLQCAYVLDGRGIAQLRYVTLGAATGNQVEVLSGMVSGERLVDAPADRDYAGKRIEVRE